MVMHMLQKILPILFLLLASGVHAETRDLGHGIVLQGQFAQGGLVTGLAPATIKSVRFQQRDLQRSATGTFVLGLGRDDDAQQQLVIKMVDGGQHSLPFSIRQREYNVQSVKGVPARTVNPDPKDMARIQQEAAAVAQARAGSSPRDLFRNGFIWPVQGPVTGVYGSQRIFNGEPRSPHFGVDVAAPAGTPILAPADGFITLAEPDLFFSGGTMIIDHGLGVSTSYLHMSKLLVKKGDQVKQGQTIGLVGATGRATGPHLCWRLNWYQSRLDPQLITPTPKP